MADNILSDDELSALLESVDGEGGDDAPERHVRDYDFLRPAKLSTEQLRGLQRLHEAAAARWSTDLSTLLRHEVTVELLSIGQLGFAVFRNSLPEPTLIDVLSLPPLPDHALCAVDMQLTFSLIDRMLGGDGSALPKLRPLTAIERSLMDNVVTSLLAAVRGSWSEVLEIDPAVVGSTLDPQAVQAIPPAEMVMIVTFNVAAPGGLEAGEVSLCVPFVGLEPVLAKLGGPPALAAGRQRQTERQREHLRDTLGNATVPFTARLGTAAVSVGEVLALQAGDVVVLDSLADRPITCEIEGVAKVTGRPGRSGRRAAVLVEEVVPTGLTEMPTKPHLHAPVVAEARRSHDAAPAATPPTDGEGESDA